jgi:hypothetical protein
MMQKQSLPKRITDALLRPRQLMMVDGRSGRPARNMMIRPLTMILIPIALLAGSFVAGMQYTPKQKDRNLIPQNLQLQREFDSAREKIAEAEAMNDLKTEQIKSLQVTIDKQQSRIENLNGRMDMFESILQARKTSGVQMLKANVRKVGNSQVEYNLVLVKGGNYPRRVSGHIKLLAIDAQQGETALLLNKDSDKLNYRMETHTFLHGTARWEGEVKPVKFVAVLFDRHGREISRTQCDIQGVFR